jgi:hypothetical protein
MSIDPAVRPRTSPLLVLALALVGISFAAPLIRLSAADPLVIATWRLGFSMLIVAAALLVGGGWREWRSLAGRDYLFAVGAGVLLAIHFWSWNASLRYTSVAASVALVNLQPVITARAIPAHWTRDGASRSHTTLNTAMITGCRFTSATDAATLV